MVAEFIRHAISMVRNRFVVCLVEEGNVGQVHEIGWNWENRLINFKY